MRAIEGLLLVVIRFCIIHQQHLLYAEAMPNAKLSVTPCISMQNTTKSFEYP